MIKNHVQHRYSFWRNTDSPSKSDQEDSSGKVSEASSLFPVLMHFLSVVVLFESTFFPSVSVWLRCKRKFLTSRRY